MTNYIYLMEFFENCMRRNRLFIFEDRIWLGAGETQGYQDIVFFQLSAGAEVIKISKRFFLQNAGNNTMLKVETMVKYSDNEIIQDNP